MDNPVVTDEAMSATTEPAVHLRRQLLEWIAERPRTYAEVLEVWRTSCPRMSIWEDACIDGLIDCTADRAHIVSLSPAGCAWLERMENGGSANGPEISSR